MEFKIISRKMPGRPTEPEKFYATIVRPNNITLETLAKRISEISPVNELDTETALLALTKVLPEYLSTGATVELGEFGRLMVNISSDGSTTEEDYNKELIKSNKISYQPSTQVKKVMKGVEYKKV
jgi:predicted histone-like DNA-binding protein